MSIDEQKNNDPEIVRIDNTRGYLALPFEGDEFREFLIGLLGKPQKIQKTIWGSFEIHLSDIQNFHHLIEQRINQQNQGSLLQFRSKITFDDRSSTELNSFEELETYNEIRPIVSTRVDLSWDYIVQFYDKDVPEKQTIDISIETNAGHFITSGALRIIENRKIGKFTITVHHTARTWAADMEAMLSNHIESLLITPKKYRIFLNKWSGRIGLSTGIIFFIASLGGSFEATKAFVNDQLVTIGNLINEAISPNDKLDVLSNYIISGAVYEHYFKVFIFLATSLVIAIFLGVWVETNIVSPERSFIVLTRKAVENRDKELAQVERAWHKFILSVIVSIITSIIANYIFTFLAG